MATNSIAALQADALDDAHVLQVRAATISSMVKDGWDPESAKVAVLSGDLSKARHTNLVSVQLMPPGTQAAPKQLPAAATNGASNG